MADESASRAITVIVPTRNVAAWLPSCLQGARLNRPHELIVVDGSSDDGTRELAEERADRVLQDDGRGVAAARQQGVVAAESEWVMLVDADVVIGPGLLDGLLREATERGLDAIQAALYSVDSGDYWSRQLTRHHRRGQVRDWFGVSATLIRREVLLRHPFDGRLGSGEDIDLRIRLRAAEVPVGVSTRYRVVHRFAAGRPFCAQQWRDDGAGLGRMVRAHGTPAVLSALMPSPAAVFGALDGLADLGRPLPYFAGFAVGNARGVLEGLRDARIPIDAARRRLTWAVGVATVLLLAAVPIGLIAALAGVAWVLDAAAHGDGWTSAIVGVAIVVALAHELYGRDRAGPHARLVRPLRGLLIALALAVAVARVVGLIF